VTWPCCPEARKRIEVIEESRVTATQEATPCTKRELKGGRSDPSMKEKVLNFGTLSLFTAFLMLSSFLHLPYCVKLVRAQPTYNHLECK